MQPQHDQHAQHWLCLRRLDRHHPTRPTVLARSRALLLCAGWVSRHVVDRDGALLVDGSPGDAALRCEVKGADGAQRFYADATRCHQPQLVGVLLVPQQNCAAAFLGQCGDVGSQRIEDLGEGRSLRDQLQHDRLGGQQRLGLLEFARAR